MPGPGLTSGGKECCNYLEALLVGKTIDSDQARTLEAKLQLQSQCAQFPLGNPQVWGFFSRASVRKRQEGTSLFWFASPQIFKVHKHEAASWTLSSAEESPLWFFWFPGIFSQPWEHRQSSFQWICFFSSLSKVSTELVFFSASNKTVVVSKKYHDMFQRIPHREQSSVFLWQPQDFSSNCVVFVSNRTCMPKRSKIGDKSCVLTQKENGRLGPPRQNMRMSQTWPKFWMNACLPLAIWSLSVSFFLFLFCSQITSNFPFQIKD